jgi:hypothetical protein
MSLATREANILHHRTTVFSSSLALDLVSAGIRVAREGGGDGGSRRSFAVVVSHGGGAALRHRSRCEWKVMLLQAQFASPEERIWMAEPIGWRSVMHADL